MIIPSIDLMDGKVVQLEKGKNKVFESEDVEKFVNKFRTFPKVNVIDLDSAMDKGSNKELIKKLCGKLKCNVGGGIRTKELALEYLRAGAKKIIIGTLATPEFLKDLPRHRVIVALDVKEGKIAVEGWQKSVEGKVAEKIKELEKYCSAFLVTNVDVEGLCEGSNLEFIKNLQGLTKRKIIVAGGISNYEEIKAIDSYGFDQVLGMALYTEKINLYKALVSVINFNKFKDGLVPTIVQNSKGKVLMLAYSSKESFTKALENKTGTYYSRSRSELWQKGDTSGHTQELLQVNYDCDADTLLFEVKQNGAACHKESYSCFSEKEFNIEHLLEFLKGRIYPENKTKSSSSSESYTKKIADNKEKLYKKIIEEAFEVILAENNGRENQVWELADLLYFMLVYMAKFGINLNEVVNELSLRHNHEL
jgi:phosphoribosyl-AMP cyclohydrolase / phosphoribosyl-ATP pyrophosphohydrolase